MEFCQGCGQLKGVKEYDHDLWDIYERIRDGRSTWEALWYTGEQYNESWDDDGETNYADLAMEKDMHHRGLCTACGRPNLSGVDPEDIMSEEDAQSMREMWAIEAQERRMGC